MKKILLSLSFVLMSFAVFADSSVPAIESGVQEQILELHEVSPDALNMSIDQFLELTPSKYKEMTGKRLGVKNTLKLKAAQKVIKKQRKKDSGITSGVYILLAILGLGWLAMGLLSDWEGSDWIINLVLTLLCWLPGLIHALINKKNYF